ncbi:hypothetical protein Tel_11785 [Candidatus Tenderia electrophaga]|uniref:Methyltransferase domain-containing protein n=1 Tax=Candidatus Tenderia electrophaga TaxID=1748243 RepID=A0A0S2TF48_9GAMM|nr:hypothetical protein Tel_11785 [Candidatus Tenderia electrophaga]
MKIWHRFSDGIPDYLARHYWWAYLWRPGVWFFDHQPIINAILFGQYKRLLRQTLQCLESRPPGRLLQLTCVYGLLSPSIVNENKDHSVYLCDVAPVQLEAVRRKLNNEGHNSVCLAHMNAEKLAFKDDSFSTVLVFFLFHELPADARSRVIDELVRVIEAGGQVIIVEYAPLPTHHFLYRIFPLRRLLMRLEPFLAEFWREDLAAALHSRAKGYGKAFERTRADYFFNRFYRVEVYQEG